MGFGGPLFCTVGSLFGLVCSFFGTVGFGACSFGKLFGRFGLFRRDLGCAFGDDGTLFGGVSFVADRVEFRFEFAVSSLGVGRALVGFFGVFQCPVPDGFGRSDAFCGVGSGRRYVTFGVCKDGFGSGPGFAGVSFGVVACFVGDPR